MALRKQKIPLEFTKGINTKVDDKQLPLGQFLRVENALFDTIRKFKKRNGYDEIELRYSDNTVIENPAAISKFKDELCLFTDTLFHSYSESTGVWNDKGSLYNIFPSINPIVRNYKQQKNLDCISVENIQCFVYQDSSGVRATLIDSLNGSIILGDALISATGSVPKVANIQSTVYFLYVDGTDLNHRSVLITDPTTISSEVTLVSNVDAVEKFDAIPLVNKIGIAYQSSDSGGELTTFCILSGGSTTTAVGITGESASNALSMTTDSNNRIYLTYANSTDVNLIIRSSDLSTEILSPTLIETVSNIVNVVSSQNSAGSISVFYEIDAVTSYNNLIRSNTCSMLGVVGTPAVLIRSLGLASKAIFVENEIFFMGIYNSTYQSTYFLLNDSGKAVSKISHNVSGSLLSEACPPKLVLTSDLKYLTAGTVKGRLISEADTFFSLEGATKIIFDFDLDSPYQTSELSENLHISAGYLYMYDGRNIVEHGFHLFPENLEFDSTATTGGSIPDGSFLYVAVYKWIDNYGQEHLSAPSDPLEVVLSGGTSTQTVTINIPTLRITNKDQVLIDVYRTEASGTIFYKVTSISSPVINLTSSDTVPFTDTTSDTALISNELLYTTGGVLENISAPASSIIETFQNRIFLADLDDKSKLQYSKIRFDGKPVEFNDSLIVNLNPKGGNISGMKVLDDKLIIWKQDSIFYLSGTGPNNLGQQDNYIEPEQISSDVGCVDKNSLVVTPFGVMFKSRKGIYLLDRSMSVQYIGSAVESFNNLTITSAVVNPTNNQVRFTTLSGECLVYNHFVGQWSTFTNHKALSSIILNSQYYYLRPDSRIYLENSSTYADNGAPIKLRIETGWISLAGIQGFKRLYRMYLLGSWKSNHKIRVKIAYNYVDAYIHEKVIDSSEIVSEVLYGEDSPYGNGLYGGAADVYQFSIDFKKQKCQSIKILIEDLQDSVGEGLELSHLLLIMGVKEGGFALNAPKMFGSHNV